MAQPESIYQSAVKYCGDPLSHERRGSLITAFLKQKGMTPNHRVLNIGCGALSEGAPLIRFLNEGNFVGTDPNQWLIRAALDHHPDLSAKNPEFSFESDFTVGEPGQFDFIVCHSVLSHVAYWQLILAFNNLRRVAHVGTVWIASLRLDQFTSFDQEWVYPGNSFYRKEDVETLAYQCGWHVGVEHEFKQRMIDSCPNDVHDWITLTPIMTPTNANELRLDFESRRQETEEIEKISREEYARRKQQELEEAV